MSVTIRPEDGQPDSLKALLADVAKHAGDEPVTISNGGVTVSRAVAKKFLNARGGTDADTTGRTVDNTRAPLVTHHADGSVTGGPAGADLTIGGRTPEGELPGGHEGVRADQRDQTTATVPGDGADAAGQAADGGDSPSAASGGAADGDTTTPPPAKKSTPAKKTTAAAQQRASRNSTRSNP